MCTAPQSRMRSEVLTSRREFLLTGFGAGLAASGEDLFAALSLVRPRRPEPAPDFTVPGLRSPRLSLRNFKGQVVFLNFWATWCPPCREEMPAMERLYRRFRTRGFAILAVSIDSRGADVVTPFVTHFGLTFPIGLDPKTEVANRYMLRALPTTVLIDRGGQIAALAFGARDWDGSAAHRVIETLLDGR